MTRAEHDWVLSIDFGTTYTTVAVRVGPDRPEIVEIDGNRRVPSVVLADEESGYLLVGRRADDLAVAQPKRAARELKRRLGEGTPVLLGGDPYDLHEVIGALLRYVAAEASMYIGSPPTRVVLTHPATWRRIRCDALVQAAAEAGLEDPLLVPEPVAAALSYAQAGNLPDGPLAVYDLGGGTFDTTILAADQGFKLLGPANGDGRVGGERFDELVVDHVGRRLPAAVWENLQTSEEVGWRQAWALLRGEVRRAKEALSLHERAVVVVGYPGGQAQVKIERPEFEAIIHGYLIDTVDILDTTVSDAGVSSEDLGAIFVVGGASRIPLVERVLTDAFPGVPLLRRGDPKMATALGGAWAVGSGLFDSRPRPAPVSFEEPEPAPIPDKTEIHPNPAPSRKETNWLPAAFALLAVIMVAILAIWAVVRDPEEVVQPPPPTTTSTAPTTTTAPPAGPIFNDDFAQNRGWPASTSTIERTYVDGTYRILAKSPQTSFLTLAPAAANGTFNGNIKVKVRAQKVSTTATFGLMCRADSSSNYYFAGINTNGYWRITKYKQGQSPVTLAFARNAAEYVTGIDPAGFVDLTVECSGGPVDQPVMIRLFVGDKLVKEHRDEQGLAPGRVGLGVSTAEDPAEVRFDDFAVSRY